MNSGYDPYGLEGRKRAVREHIERYRKLRDAGSLEQALEELRTATKLANESVEHTIEVSRTILSRIEDLFRAEVEKSDRSAEMDRDQSG